MALKIRDPLLLKNPGPNHAKFVTCPSAVRAKPLSHFSPFPIPWKIVFGDGQESTFLARCIDVFHPSPPSPKSQTHAKGRRSMSKRLIRVQGDDFTGWCCSHCTWGITTPRLESTVGSKTNSTGDHFNATIAT